MHEKFTTLTPALYKYLIEHMTEPDSVLRELAEETMRLGDISAMQIAHEQGAFLTMLTRLINAKQAVDLGTFTGYSAICIARGLAPGGTLLTCEVNEEWAQVARQYFKRAGLEDKITLKLGPALDTLRALPDTAHIDLAFIDADKVNYRAYYEELLPRTRENGVIIFDNVLWGGAVIDPRENDPATVAIRELNDFLKTDSRVEVVMLPISDGLTLARKRESHAQT
jgi:caffeoyl-CoA O-methyltransferase